MILRRKLAKITQIICCNKNPLSHVRLLHVVLGVILLWPLCCVLFYNSVLDYNGGLSNLIVNHLIVNRLRENKTGCVIPEFDIFSHDVLNNIDLHYRPKIVCPGKDWVKCFKSECYVILEEVKDHIECSYADIIYVNDDDYYISSAVLVPSNGKYILNRSDHVAVSCFAKSAGLPIRSNWMGFKAGLRPVPLPPTPRGRKNEYNVMVVIFDSTSRNGFIRFMPKSYTYLTEKMNAVIFDSYNSLGEDTCSNMFPVLTGKAKTELPETRKSRPVMGQYVNYKDFIFYQAKQMGYRTAYFEEYEAAFSTYNNGFRKQPADHYLRSFMQEVQSRKALLWKTEIIHKVCLGDAPVHQQLLNLTKDFLDLDGKKISVTHIVDISHHIFNLISNADDDLVDLLSTLRQREILEDTLMIVMSDHGQRYDALRNTYQGRIESYLPLMAVALPERLKRLRPKALEALEHNKNVLTTHFDLHATLMDVLDLPYTNKYVVPGASLPRSISLLRKIPKSRTCNEAGILPHFCVCTPWHNLTKYNPLYFEVVDHLVVFINNIISEVRYQCKFRQLRTIKWVRYKEFPESFQTRNKLYNNFFKSEPVTEYYQAKIVMTPSDAEFEGTLVYHVEPDYFDIEEENIVRTNPYNNQSDCIKDTFPHLRPFCFCKKAKSKRTQT